MIVEWMDADTIESIDAQLICSAYEYMRYSDEMIIEIIGMLDADRDKFVINRLEAERERRLNLDVG